MIDCVDDAAEFMRWLGQRHEVLAVDTETEGLNWTKHKVRLIQVGDRMDGWAMPWDLWGGVALEALGKYEGQVVMHNAKFDTHMIDRWMGHSIPRHRIDDTMIMAHIMDPTRPVGLKPLTAYHIDRKAAAASVMLDEAMTLNGWGWDTVPIDFPLYWQYGALDTVLTCRLWELLKPQVMADAPKAYDLEMANVWVTQRMERKGCQLDVPYTEGKLHDFRAYVEEAGAWCEQQYGVYPGSNQKVIQRLQADGIEFWKHTPAGALSLDKEVLEGIVAATGHPLAATVLQRRRLEKLASTYLANFLTQVGPDGRIRPNVKVLGARTSRESVTEPALQTLPRKSEASPAAIAVRNCITASPDSSLIMCDFSQIEMRMFAHFAEDPGLSSAFVGHDFFVNVARELYQDMGLVKSDPRRQFTKNGMYALGYGAGAEKIALTTGQTLERVKEFLDLLAIRYPGIKRLQRNVQSAALQRKATEGVPYVRSPLTNRRHVADEGKEYALVNYLIQGTAAEVFKTKKVEAANAGLEDYMILGVHDEIILDVPNDLADDVARLIPQVMSDDKMFSVPLEAEVSQAFRWGEAVK